MFVHQNQELSGLGFAKAKQHFWSASPTVLTVGNEGDLSFFLTKDYTWFCRGETGQSFAYKFSICKIKFCLKKLTVPFLSK